MILAEDLKLLIKNKAHRNGNSPQDIMQMYFFERLLYRISKSKYKNNFILKGGLLLSAIVGDERRTTQDMDTMIKGIDLDEKTLLPIVKEIINIDGNDDITFDIVRVKDIRREDIYGGIKIYLMGKKEHLKVPLTIDVTTKDPITPRELSFKYKCMFEDKYINIMAFSTETFIAEKFETLLKDTISNTRAKDFYDLYMLIREFIDSINEENIIKAIKNTCKRRDSLNILDNLTERFELIRNSSIMKERWNKYSQKYVYANNISYEEVIYEINKIVKIIAKEFIVN